MHLSSSQTCLFVLDRNVALVTSLPGPTITVLGVTMERCAQSQTAVIMAAVSEHPFHAYRARSVTTMHAVSSQDFVLSTESATRMEIFDQVIHVRLVGHISFK